MLFSSPRLASFTVRVRFPGILLACTTTTSWPLKSFICGSVNGSSDVASPLHTPRKVPAPLTLKVSWSSASGMSVAPSVSETVMKASASALAGSHSRSEVSSRVVGVPAVFTVFSAALRPFESYATTLSSPGW